jgi:ribosomal protein S18 acetylase RimI-like enzyme
LIAVRRADEDEAEAIADLHRRTVLHAYAPIFPSDAPVPTLDELVGNWRARFETSRIFVASASGELIGVVSSGEFEASGHLSGLHVDPSHWGRGIGRALHDRVLADFELRSLETGTLWVLERNDRARSWYERLGWIDTGRRKPVYEPADVNDAFYRIDLNAPGGV